MIEYGSGTVANNGANRGGIGLADSALKRYAMQHIINRAPWFRPGFAQWLQSNWRIYRRFDAEARQVHARGRKHYSANTIVEVMRHETALADRDSEWKLNDKWTSSMARLFALMNPDCAALFEFRSRSGAVVRLDEEQR